MPLAEQIDAPPGVFLRDILGAIIRHIIPAVHRLDPRPAVTVKPFAPNLCSPHVFAVTSAQRMDMVAITSRILFQRVEIRHAPHLRAHEFFVTALRRPDGRLPPRQTFGQRTGTVSQKTGLPQDTLATEFRHRCTAPSLPLHSAGQVSSLRGLDRRDQSGFGFSALLAPNPKPLSSRRAGAPTTPLAWNDIRSHHRRLNLERVAWHPMRILLTRTPHPLTFRKDFWPCTGQHEIPC